MRTCLSVALFFALLGAREAWAQGNPLGPEFRVNTFTGANQRLANIASDPVGNFMVVWASNGQDGSGYGVYAQRFAASGAPLGAEFRVNTIATGSQNHPSVAADAAGNFVVVWSGGDASNYGVIGQRFAASGAPLGGEFRVNTYTTGEQSYPVVAASASGTFVVLWRSDLQDGSDLGIFGQLFAASGAPLGGEFRVNSYTTFPQHDAAAAFDGAGNFVVTWSSFGQDGSLFGIVAQRFDAGGAPVGGEFQVNTYATGQQYLPAVAMGLSGDFVVVWSSFGQDGSNRGAFGQRFAASGAALGPEFRVNTYTTSYQYQPRVAADASGDFVVAWSSFGPDGAGYGVAGQRFAASGTPLGGEFVINTYTTNSQKTPCVSALPTGEFVVAWQSFTQDGSGFGIYAQRYGPILPVELMQFGLE